MGACCGKNKVKAILNIGGYDHVMMKKMWKKIKKQFNWKPIMENVEYSECFEDCKMSPEGILHRLGREMNSSLQLWIYECDFAKARTDQLPVRLVIEIFLWAGVNPNWRDRRDNNALHSALTVA